MERREYTRVNVGAQSEFFLYEGENMICDFAGIIDNVSEGGLGILVEKDTYEQVGNKLEVGLSISFQAYDENGYSIEASEGAFSGRAEIVRKEPTEETLIVGCKIDETCNDFKEYVKDKKVYLYISSMRKNN